MSEYEEEAGTETSPCEKTFPADHGIAEKAEDIGWHCPRLGAEVGLLPVPAARFPMEPFVSRLAYNSGAVMQCHIGMWDGGHELHRIWADTVHAGIVRNFENAARLLACRTLAEFTAAQNDILRTAMEFWFLNNFRLSERTVQAAHGVAERCRLARL